MLSIKRLIPKFCVIIPFIVMLVGTLQRACAYPTELYPEISFKTLESGESSGEIVNQCCQRESKFITVGYGISEGEVRIDVGECQQKCVIPIVKPLKRDEFDKYLRRYPDMDPIQIFLSLQTKTAMRSDSASSGEIENGSTNNYQDANSHRITTSCLQSECLPSSVKREIYYDLSGEVKDFDVIESCECVSLPQEGCQRISSMVKVNVDSPYERELDIGKCIGSCDDDSEHCLSCRPVRNRTISVEGPNGAQCLNVIDECQCVGNCFRVRQFLKVFDYTHVFEGPLTNDVNGTVIRTTNTNSSINGIPRTMNESATEPLTKVIDIGRCSGSCSDVPLASKCLVWSTTNNGTCLSALTGGRSKCTATKFVSHSYMDKHGKRHTVVSVTGCSCR
ncbi:unnamed protein product [Orchesella dallaii]|uniref:Uncharacterized protein n=1 Tax=Orchesella dallaii TaxID=48710 RepID=A0ABP1QWV2_9HEXA